MSKRSPRTQLGKKVPIRQPYDRVLIVCEGKKTEPNYLQELCNQYKLSTANIEIVPGSADPRELVEKALELAKQEKLKKDRYESIYCVFDRDSHVHFEDASSKANSNSIRLARSWPCFEYWVLLHYRYTRSPFTATGNKSSADKCIEVLKQEFPNYTKGSKAVFNTLSGRLKKAMEHATQAFQDAQDTLEKNPSTEFHILVDYLISLDARQK